VEAAAVTEPKPNIITVGVAAGAATQMLVWFWNGLGLFAPLGAAEAAALTTIITALAQWLDRQQKRAQGYVIAKYAGQQPGQPPEPRDDAA
jgi:hypothetical protein